MDLWQLYIFTRVVELKSFSKAGESAHLSQPTVSSHMKDLEDHFGCRLIDRLSKEAIPTRAGELLYQYARRLVALRDEAETAMTDFLGKVQGRLTIGGSTIPAVYMLPKLIGAFTNARPGVTLALIVKDTGQIIEDVLAGTLELGIVGALSSDKKISQKKLIEDEMCLVVPAGHPWASVESVTLDMLFQEPFIVRESGSGTLRSFERHLIENGFCVDELRIAAEMGSTEAVIQGIKNHVGISILSRIAVEEELKSGALCALRIDGVDIRQEFYLTTNTQRTPSPLAGAFIEFVEQSARDRGIFGQQK